MSRGAWHNSCTESVRMTARWGAACEGVSYKMGLESWKVPAVILLIAGLAACSDQTGGGAPGGGPPGMGGMGASGPVEVGVVTLTSGAVARSTMLPGRVAASATAEIRPEVAGLVKEISFQEGANVAEGDALYVLDAVRYQAEYDAAVANLRRAEAEAVAAKAAVDRAERLAESETISQEALEEARTNLAMAQADVAVQEANRQSAEISLDKATIRAPIEGIIGKSSVSVGALVTANQSDALATIRQIDPIFVELVDSSVNLLKIRDQFEAGLLDNDGEPPAVQLTLESGRVYERTGTISLADIVISESTGTFLLRAVFDNPDQVLLPGMFVRAVADLGETSGAFLVPQRAVSRNAAGEATAYFVSEDGKAENRVLTTTISIGNDWLVTGGVSDGDRVIVDGLQKIGDGTEVTPLEVEIDEDGVVKQELATAGDPAQAPEVVE